MRKVLLILAISFVIFNSSFVIIKAQLQGQARIDSLLQELPKMKDDTNKVNLMADLSYTYYSINPDEGIKYGELGLELAEKIDWVVGHTKCFNSLGTNYAGGKSNYPKALELFLKSLKINKELGRKSSIASSLNNIGFLYYLQSDYPKALEYSHQALKINEELGIKHGIATNLGNIGLIYYRLTDYPKALEYSHQALKINEELFNKLHTARNLGDIGNIYSDKKDFSKAFEHYFKALEIYKELGSKDGIARNLGNIGVLYLIQSKDSIIDKNENRLNLIYNKENNLNKAIEYLNLSNLLSQEIGEMYDQSYFLNNLAQAYELKGDYKNAFKAFEEYINLQDSTFSMDKQKEIANLEAKRENELKDAEIKILQTEKKAQQLQSYLLGGGVIVLFGAFGIAFLRFREKKKLSDKLAYQNNEIETQKLIVDEKNEQIVASITYASTIQHAILPWASVLESAFNEIFIIYTPKDIVSGDSYWFQEIDGIKYLAVIDCTGHGIPGSMLTVIASSVLDDAVLSKRLTDTGEILTYMNNKVTEVLNQRLKENEIRDGMELALIAVKENKIQFSGAGRPLYLKNGTLEIIKTDKRGIAGQTENDEYQFSSFEIEKSENLLLYLTTDGFADQMNEESKKYSTKRFVNLLETISDKPMEEQNQILDYEFNSHKGSRNQIDDITILGVKL